MQEWAALWLMKQEERRSIEQRFAPIRQALLTNAPERLPDLYPELVSRGIPMTVTDSNVTEADVDRALDGDPEVVVEQMDSKDALEVLRMLGNASALSDEDLSH